MISKLLTPDLTIITIHFFHQQWGSGIIYCLILLSQNQLLLLNTSSTEKKLVLPKHFITGKIHAQILRIRLRTNCSALNYNLFLKNITDSPLWRCGDIEKTYHFFIQCPHYRNSRTELFEAVSQYKEISRSTSFQYYFTLLRNKWENIRENPKIYNHYQEIHCYAVILRMYKIIFVKFGMQLVLFGCKGVFKHYCRAPHPLSLSHTHTHTHTRARARAHTHTLCLSLSVSLSISLSLSVSLSFSLSLHNETLMYSKSISRFLFYHT